MQDDGAVRINGVDKSGIRARGQPVLLVQGKFEVSTECGDIVSAQRSRDASAAGIKSASIFALSIRAAPNAAKPSAKSGCASASL